jgi:hypothetical protein
VICCHLHIMTAYIWHAGNGSDRASVCDSTILRNKRIFPNWLIWFISNLWRKIKGVNYAQRILYIYVIILEFTLPHAYILELLACCGADARGPSRSSAHSRLTTLPSSTVGTVYRQLHILSTVTYLSRLL